MVYRDLYSYRQRERVIALFPNIFFVLFLHREHTILLSRELERVNKGTKRMNSLPLSSLVISFILRDFTAKTAAYKSCVTLKR